LRTDAHGVMRAAQGMLVTTERRSDAQGHAKDMGETVERLAQALAQQENLTRLAQQHSAQHSNTDQSDIAKAIKAQNDAIRGEGKTAGAFPEFTTPHLTFASPVGIQTTTAGSTHLASDEHLGLTTGGHVGVAVGRSWFASVAERFSVFVHKLGIKLIAASGKVRVEAQSDDVEVIAKRAVEIMSTSDWIVLKAKKGIRVNGGGSELEISSAGILGFTDGQHMVHASDHKMEMPQARPLDFPLSSSQTIDQSFPYSL